MPVANGMTVDTRIPVPSSSARATAESRSRAIFDATDAPVPEAFAGRPRAHVDDASRPLRTHHRDDRLHHRGRCHQVELEQRTEVRERGLLDAGVQPLTGVADEDVDPTEGLRGGPDECVDLGGVGHVAPDGDRAPELLRQVGEAILTPSGPDHTRGCRATSSVSPGRPVGRTSFASAVDDVVLPALGYAGDSGPGR